MIFALTRRGALLSMAASAALLFAVPALADDVTITFWGSYGNGGNSTQQDALNNTLIPAFEAAHPGIKVKYVDIPYDSLLQKLTTSAAGGELPDLVRSDLGWVPQFAKLGVLLPLSDAMGDFKDLALPEVERQCSVLFVFRQFRASFGRWQAKFSGECASGAEVSLNSFLRIAFGTFCVFRFD